LVESTFNEAFQLCKHSELLASSCSGSRVFFLEGATEVVGIIKKNRVALFLVRGCLADGGLSGNASTKVLNLIFKGHFVLLKALNVAIDAFFLFIEHLDSLVVFFHEVVPCGHQVISEGVE
jgi:hypothetical protein